MAIKFFFSTPFSLRSKLSWTLSVSSNMSPSFSKWFCCHYELKSNQKTSGFFFFWSTLCRDESSKFASSPFSSEVFHLLLEIPKPFCLKVRNLFQFDFVPKFLEVFTSWHEQNICRAETIFVPSRCSTKTNFLGTILKGFHFQRCRFI